MKTRGARPIFLHSLFRSGSTYMFSKFRSHDACYAYYEPLHELLAVVSREYLANEFHGMDIPAYLRHPPLEKPYFDELPFRQGAIGVRFFRQTFATRNYVLKPGQEQKPIERYVRYLIQHSKTQSAKAARPVFQFTRTSFRMGWLNRKFNALSCYSLRDPESNWWSQEEGKGDYFFPSDLMLILRNRRNIWFSELARRLELPAIKNQGFGNDIMKLRVVGKLFTPADRYFVFYYFWLATLLQALAHCDFVMDLNLISSLTKARRNAESFWLRHGLKLSFSDCRMPLRRKLLLDAARLKQIELDVERLLASKPTAREVARLLKSRRVPLTLLSNEHRDRLARLQALFR